MAAGVITLFLASFRLLTEVFQLCQLGLEYLKDVTSWIEITLFICSIIFVSVFKTECMCPRPTQWQFGIVAVFLAWTDFILFVEKLPRVGIYVVMLIHMLWIFLTTVPLAVMLVIAFGLALFMAFFEPGILVSLLYLFLESYSSQATALFCCTKVKYPSCNRNRHGPGNEATLAANQMQQAVGPMHSARSA